jgi:radical SAM superfamily enzyme YgiQ (UPF0313 family)
MLVIREEKPDIIGFSCMTGIHSDAVKIADSIKRVYPGIPIILGGPHPTFFPEIIEESCIDIVCRGEGEEVIGEIMDALNEGWEDGSKKIRLFKNLHVKINGEIIKNPQRPLIDPLDNLPMLDWSCYKNTIILTASPVVLPIRGCPYNCTYCFNDGYKTLHKGLGKTIRALSAERAVEEIKETIKVFAKNPVIFNSDTFGIDIAWMKSFLQKYSENVNLPFVVLLRPELATENVISTLAEYNCYCVAIGVESGSERVRKDILNRNYSNELLFSVAERLHKYGIPFRTYNMLGLLSETEQEIWDTININIKMKADFPRAAIFTPMPGTRMTAQAIKKGYLDFDFSYDDIPKTILEKTVLKNVDADKIKNYMYFFQTAVLFPKAGKLISKLVNYRPNIFYKIWFYFVYVYLHRKSEGRSLFSYIKYVLANRNYK